MAKARTLKAIIRAQHREMANAMETTNALMRENEGLRGALESCMESLERTDMDAPEDAAVRSLCERIGYGAVMDAAARLWGRKDDHGAFTVGPCRATARAAMAEWWNDDAPPAGRGGE